MLVAAAAMVRSAQHIDRFSLTVFFLGIKTYSNTGMLQPIAEDASVKSFYTKKPTNIDIDDVSLAVSALGIGDDSVFDEKTIGFKSAYQKAVDKGEKPVKVATLRGNTKIGLPYILDLWRDCNGRVRISIQLWMLSGDDFYSKVLARVSTDGKAYVIAFPMDLTMERSDSAFGSFVMNEPALAQFPKDSVIYLLKNHPKSIARIHSVSKIKQRAEAGEFFYEQRIPLPRKVQRGTCTIADGDMLFTGQKFVKYSNGTVHMHTELVSEQKDGYCPKENLKAPTTVLAGSAPIRQQFQRPVPMEVETTPPPAALLAGEYSPDAASTQRRFKRTKGDAVGRPKGDSDTVPTAPLTASVASRRRSPRRSPRKTPPTAVTPQLLTGKPFMDPVEDDDDDDSDYNTAADDSDDSLSHIETMYEEETIASRLSMPMKTPDNWNPTLQFASSLQQAAEDEDDL